MNLISPLLSLCLVSMASTYMVTLITLRLNSQGIPDSYVGIIHTTFYMGLLLGARFVEKQISRIGYIRSFAVFGALTAACFLVLGLLEGTTEWIINRFIQGYCLAGLYVTIEGWLLASSTVQTRGKILAWYMFFLYGAQAISQLILKTGDNLSNYPFIISALLSVIGIIPVLLVRQPAPEIPTPPPLKVMEYLKAAPFGIFGCFISGIVLSSIYAFGPNFAQESKIDEALMMFSLIFGGLLLQFPIGKASDRFDRRKVVLLTGLLSLLPTLILFFFSQLPIMILSSIFLGGFAFALYPLAVSQVIDQHQEDSILPAPAMALFAYGCGSVLGPVICASLFTLIGYIVFLPYLFFLFMLNSSSSLLALKLDRKQKIGPG